MKVRFLLKKIDRETTLSPYENCLPITRNFLWCSVVAICRMVDRNINIEIIFQEMLKILSKLAFQYKEIRMINLK